VLIVIHKPFVLSVIMLSVGMMSVVVPKLRIIYTSNFSLLSVFFFVLSLFECRANRLQNDIKILENTS
jgi:hypothetical protein